MEGLSETPNATLESLNQKHVESAAPGIHMSEEYYSYFNSEVQLNEVTWNLGRYITSLSNLNFGSFSQITIPNQLLVSNLYLTLVLPAVLVNQTVAKSWGYGMIQSLSWLLGNSNVPIVTIQGPSVFMTILGEAETSEKANEIIVQSGQEQILPTTGNIYANVLLPLPFSSACALQAKKAYDSSMLNNTIQLQIQFNNANSIYGGTNTTIPNSFIQAQIVAFQGEFYNKANSLSVPLRSNLGLQYTFPFIHKQSAPVPQFTGSTSTTAPVNITLQSIINSDLVGIYFYVVQTANVSSISGSSPSPFLADPISNVTLTFNGNVMYQAPNVLCQLVDSKNIPGAFTYNTNLITSLGGGGAPFLDTPQKCYITELSFAKMRSLCSGSKMSNVTIHWF
jgi:hypothetical protein